ncbi:MAG: hypothetical protein ABSA47_09730 [Verrucomicrobiota bacterium]|jgi:hypothetical protein
MKLNSRGLAGMVFALGVVSPVAMASESGVVTLDQVLPYYYDVGGEFAAFVSSGSQFVQNYAPVATVGTAFDTFCVEVDTDFNPGGTYDFSMNLLQDNEGRALTKGAAYLYYEFATGNLVYYNYAVPNALDPRFGYADAGELQQAIWWFQDYQHYDDAQYPVGTNNFYYQLALSNLGLDSATAETPNDGAFGVGVFQMTDPGSGDPAQNQLVLVSVPDQAGTLAMLALGLAGLAVFADGARRFGPGRLALQPCRARRSRE